MTDPDLALTEITEHELPFGRRVRLVDARHESGLRMLRLIWREGTRITQIEIAPGDAARLGSELTKWARETTASDA
ncbi:MAG: hypothetical protein ACE5DK_04760 [Paracoccaceae bacterium]